MNRLAERTWVRLAIFAVLALAVVWSMLPTAAWANQFRDAQVIGLHEHAAVDAVTRFGELPLWDPWYCGGLYGLGAPQSRFASPPFLLSLLLGPERATPILVFLLTLLGMEGAYRWIRLRVTDASSALRVAPLFALSGHFAVAHYRGWTNFFGFELVPFVLLGVTLAARGRVIGILLSGLAFAFILGFGGTFAAPLLAVALLVESVRSFLEQPPSQRRRAAFMLLALASFLATLAMFRLFPLAETLAASPRIMAGTPGHSPKTLVFELVKALDPTGGDIDANGQFFVGGLFVALVALGGSDRRSIKPLLIVLVFLWLAAGYARRPPLFALLRELPVFSALRYPERFLWICILYACEPAANALAKLPLLGDGRRWRVGAHVVLTAAVVLTVGTQIEAFARLGEARRLGAVTSDAGAPREEFHQARGNRWLASHYESMNVGSLSCWEAYPVVMSPKLRGDLPAEEYLADPGAGTARRTAWSPNHIAVHVVLARSTQLLVNQNWHPGWHASLGSVVSDEGLLGVELPAGEHDVELRFAPRSALAGGVVSLVALLALGVLVILGRRAPLRPVAALLVVAPWVALAGFVATWTEPRYPPPTPRNADGSPALAAVPTDARPLAAQLDVPVVVDAYKLTGPDAFGSVTVELWLRRTGPVPRTTSLFAHVERADREHAAKRSEGEKRTDHINADHQVVGGSFYLSDAPLGEEIHDTFGVNLEKLVPARYEVRLAFGHVSGKRGNLAVLHAEGAVDGGWLVLGTFDHHD